MARKPGDDERQKDFFGAPVAAAKQLGASPNRRRRSASSSSEAITESDDIDVQVARLSPAELRNLVAMLPDDVLAQLTLATVLQLKRRLARDSRRESKGRASVLDRAAQQLIAELSGQGEHDDDDYDF